MDTERTAEGAVLITVAAGQGSGMLARDTLARAFGLGRDEAERVLSQGGALVEPRIAAQDSCLVLLRLLGVQVQPVSSPAARHDLSVRICDPKDSVALARIAAHCPAADLTTLGGVSGLVLTDLTLETARAKMTALQRIPGIQVTLAPQTGALYDIFAPERFAAPEALRRYLVLLGHGATAPVATLGEALASSLSAPHVNRLLTRFAGLGLVAVNQLFQRFSLHVTGSGQLSQREAADFLLSRGHFEAGLALMRGESAAVECGLNRSTARNFLNDYRHIGLSVRLSLCQGTAQNG